MKLPRTVSRPRRLRLGIASVAALGMLVAVPASAQAAATPVPLGTANSFVVIAGATVTNIKATTLNGDVGLAAGSSVTGKETITLLNGAYHVADATAVKAKADVGTAYDNARLQLPSKLVATELGNPKPLTPGVYKAGKLGITKTLTLDAQGDPNAVFVFQSADTLITASDSHVNLINGASPCNVFWQVSKSATLGSGSTFSGTILALQSIDLDTGAKVKGRAFARTGAVTMKGNTIDRSMCAAKATAAPSAQVTQVPKGSVRTGDGSTSGGLSARGLLAGLLAFAALGGATVVATRRRRGLNA
ncbi:MAG: DUF3494 domain-containing protein [Dermatophilaceae bacterium]|nr:DUF3494 domain-containing protein [Dermatophilaceae bacterium]